MFTSRAEYRLILRADNADQRLTNLGIALGCVGSGRAAHFNRKSLELDRARAVFDGLKLTPNEARQQGLNVNQDGVRRSAFDLLAYPDIDGEDILRIWPQVAEIAPDIREQLAIDALYSGYLERQKADIRDFRKDEELTLPENIRFEEVAGLSTEIRLKLSQVRPTTLGQAARISGVTPAALTALLSYVKRGVHRQHG